MRIRFIAAVAVVSAMAVACSGDKEDPVNVKPDDPIDDPIDDPVDDPVEPRTYSFSADPESLHFTAKGGEATFYLTTDADWKAECAAEWVTFGHTSGQGDDEIFVSVPANPDQQNGREATIVFTVDGDGKGSLSFPISQDAAEKEQPATGSQPGWYELPAMDIADDEGYRVSATDGNLYYAWHFSPDVYGPGNRLARNYTVCFSAAYHCPVWVAAPRHAMYVGGSGRNDSYRQDPDIPGDIQYNAKSTGGGCNKGHMLGSAERTCSVETNRQVFYYSNIAPQLSSGFNTGGGGWNILEDYVDTQVCADTLYEVVGCYFDRYTDAYGKTQTPQTISFGGRSDVSMPTMFYYALLRTKSGNSGKAVKDCSASELQCVAFVRAHVNTLKGQQVTATELMSVSDLEAITGFSYFTNVPNAPKDSFRASDWGL